MASFKAHQNGQNAMSIIYNILWMEDAAGKQEPTRGLIEIVSAPTVLSDDSPNINMPSQHATRGLQEDVLLADTSRSSTETLQSNDEFTSECQSAISHESSMISTHSASGNPCIAKLSWGSWEAIFHCIYDQPKDSFRSQDKSFFAFGIQDMNEWMEMALMGKSTTVPRLICEEIDDHSHEFIKMIIVWNWSGPNISQLYAKRATGDRDWELSESECGRLGITVSSHIVEGSTGDGGLPQSNPDLPREYETVDKSLRRKERGEPRGESRSRRGYTSRGRTTSRARGNFRGREGFGSRARGHLLPDRVSGDVERGRGRGFRGNMSSRSGHKLGSKVRIGNDAKTEAREVNAQSGLDNLQAEDLIIC